MRTILLDDEQPAIQLLTAFVSKVPFMELQLATTRPLEVLKQLELQQTDLLLLDIEMPDMTGIELLKSLKNPPLVIFTTAYEQYALKGFELDVVDYLMKPIRFERFLKATNKAKKLLISEANIPPAFKEEFLFVKANYQTVKIAFSDILYIEGLKDYVKIYTEKEMIMTRLNMKGMEAKLPKQAFIRIHRSFIISFAKITAFQKSQVTIGVKNLPIGETYRTALTQLLNKK